MTQGKYEKTRVGLKGSRTVAAGLPLFYRMTTWAGRRGPDDMAGKVPGPIASFRNIVSGSDLGLFW